MHALHVRQGCLTLPLTGFEALTPAGFPVFLEQPNRE
jgi:hypothetical protein